MKLIEAQAEKEEAYPLNEIVGGILAIYRQGSDRDSRFVVRASGLGNWEVKPVGFVVCKTFTY